MLKRILILAILPAVSSTVGLTVQALTDVSDSPAAQVYSAPQSTAGVDVRPLSRALRAPAAASPRKAPPVAARPRPKALPHGAVPTRPAPTHKATARPAPPPATPQQRLDEAISRIRGYGTFDVTWVLRAKDGYWGTADWYTNTIYISPRVPRNRLFDVAVHEWSHLKSVKDYGGDVNQAVSEMNRYFGGSDLTGAERAADCMARLEGAGWTHYTSCSDSHWRQGAARLLAGGRL